MNTCPQCHSHWSTGIKHEVEPRPKSKGPQRTQWSDWSKWEDQSWHKQSNWDNRGGNRSASRKRQEQYSGRPASPRARKGKGTKKGKDKDKEDAMTVPKAMQPFGGKQTEVVDTGTGNTGNSGGAASSASTVPFTSAQIYAQNQEFVTALRKAYPDAETTPEDVTALIERTEKDLAKTITTNIHANTRALSKAQKALSEAMEARKKHRTAWMEYLKEGLQAWETSLESYRKQQAVLQESAAKARQDIAMARQAIEVNAKAAVDPSTLKLAKTQAIKEEQEEAGLEEPVDQEEEKLRSTLQGVLNACASSLGLQPDGTKPAETTQEISDSEDEGRNAKRPRSKDAGERSLGS